MKNNEIGNNSNSVKEFKNENSSVKLNETHENSQSEKYSSAKKHVNKNFNYWAGSHFLFYNVA